VCDWVVFFVVVVRGRCVGCAELCAVLWVVCVRQCVGSDVGTTALLSWVCGTCDSAGRVFVCCV
jgi:hypothetical protein